MGSLLHFWAGWWRRVLEPGSYGPPFENGPVAQPLCEGWSGRMDEHDEPPACDGCVTPIR